MLDASELGVIDIIDTSVLEEVAEARVDESPENLIDFHFFHSPHYGGSGQK